MKWLGDYRAAAYVEHERFADLETAKIYCYNLPTASFENLYDAGMWVSRVAVKPLRCDALFDFPSTFAPRGVDLRVVDGLLPLKPLWETTLHVSGVRLRNAKGSSPPKRLQTPSCQSTNSLLRSLRQCRSSSVPHRALPHQLQLIVVRVIARPPRAFVISLGGFGRLALQLREFRCHRRIRAGQLLDRHVLRLVVRQA